VTGQLGPHELETQGGDVEQEGIDALALAEVRAVLDTLTEEQRDVVTLRVIGDLSLEETAEVMGKRVGAVKALQRRALMNLKSQLQDGESQ
jgi:RNA polymerase sigma-70 factor (ECF subfamily)